MKTLLLDTPPAAGILPPEFDGMPDELRALPRWVLWRAEVRRDKLTKVPYQANGRKAADTRPNEWTNFDTARDAFNRGGFAGVGFVFNGDGLAGVDLDHCRDAATGGVEPWAQAIIDSLDTYSELSISGTGVHLLLRGSVPPGGNRKGRIEVYDWGRYFCMTGRPVNGHVLPIADRQAELAALHSEIFGGQAGGAHTDRADGDGQAPTPPAADRAGTPHGPAIEPADEADVIVKREALYANDRQFAKSWDRERKDFLDQSASVYDLSIGTVAALAGFTDAEIVTLWLAWRTMHGEDPAKALRASYQQPTFDKIHALARKHGTGGQVAANPAPKIDPDAAVKTIQAILRVQPARVIRRVDGDTSCFIIRETNGREIVLGDGATILSGAKLQARMMDAGVMVGRHKADGLYSLGDALLAVAVVEELPGAGELVVEHVRDFLASEPVHPVNPANPTWWAESIGHGRKAPAQVYAAAGLVPGGTIGGKRGGLSEPDAASHRRVYLSLSGLQKYLQGFRVQSTGKSLAAGLAAEGWAGVRFQHAGQGRRLWRSPPGFWNPQESSKTSETPSSQGE